MEPRPLVTVAMYVRNQAGFVREALESILAQTYRPLQIVFSDDASTDGTYDIVRAVADNYRGPHELVLNRNERARGPGGQINRIMELAKGELIVQAHGDDVARSDRVERLWEEWEASDRRAKLLYSAMTTLDDTGGAGVLVAYVPVQTMEKVGSMLEDLTGWRCLGCASAFDREVYDWFGPLRPEMMYEDRVLPVRARMLGEIRYIADSLLRYRSHAGNISAHATRAARRQQTFEAFLRTIGFCCHAYKGHLRDMRVAKKKGRLTASEYAAGRATVRRQVLALAWLPGILRLPFGRRLTAFRRALAGRAVVGGFLNGRRGYQQLFVSAVSPMLLRVCLRVLDTIRPRR